MRPMCAQIWPSLPMARYLYRWKQPQILLDFPLSNILYHHLGNCHCLVSVHCSWMLQFVADKIRWSLSQAFFCKSTVLGWMVPNQPCFPCGSCHSATRRRGLLVFARNACLLSCVQSDYLGDCFPTSDHLPQQIQWGCQSVSSRILKELLHILTHPWS